MNTNPDVDEALGIPEFLKRAEPKAAAPVQSEVVKMSDVDADPVEQAPTKARKPRKAAAKANGASKPAKVVKAAPKATKAASKPAKVKAKAKAKAKAPSKVQRDAYGFKVGTIKAQAAAMYASKKGATLGEVKDKLDSVQLNLLTKLESEGFKVSKVKEDGPGSRQVTRYFLRAK